MKNKTKIGVVSLLLVLAIMLCACGSSVKASDLAVKVGKSTIETLDKYLNMETTVRETERDISDLNSQLNYLLTEDSEIPTHYYDMSVSATISAIVEKLVEIMYYGITTESFNELLALRNDLAKEVGVKMRKS